VVVVVVVVVSNSEGSASCMGCLMIEAEYDP
jgi:hypothetical protein